MVVRLLLLAAGLISLGGLIAVPFVIAMAPLGYQDESGFHIGTPTAEAPADASSWGNPGLNLTESVSGQPTLIYLS